MSIKTVFDSNVWVASIIEKDLLHKKAKQVLLKHSGVFFLTDHIVAEVITVLKKYKALNEAKNFTLHVFGSDDFVVIPSTVYFDETIEYFVNSNDNKLSFTDMSLIVLSKKYKIISFDKDLNKKLKSH